MALPHTAANTCDTIWNDIPLERFMDAVKNVFEQSNQVPEAPRVYIQAANTNSTVPSALPREIEAQLAEDFAFIAANEEGPHVVSAVSVTLDDQADGITINVASNSGVNKAVQISFADICRNLERCSRKELSLSGCIEGLFDLVVKLDERKIVSRLRSGLWSTPANYNGQANPLCSALRSSLQAVSTANPAHRPKMLGLIHQADHLSNLVKTADREGQSKVHENLKSILKAAGDFVDLEELLESHLQQRGVFIAEKDKKTLRALDKLINYWKICNRLGKLAASRQHRSLFASMHLKFIEHYSGRKVNQLHRYVHAEIQLAIYHLLQKDSPCPTTIGTSKAACYLCNMFLAHHGRYAFSASHGRLYDRWTIPDLLAYSKDDRQHVRGIIHSMFRQLIQKATLTYGCGRPYPNESAIWHEPNLPSLTATVLSLSDDAVEQKPAAKITYLSLHEKLLKSNTSEVQTGPPKAPTPGRSQTIGRPASVTTSRNIETTSLRDSSTLDPPDKAPTGLDASTLNNADTASRAKKGHSDDTVTLPNTRPTRPGAKGRPSGSTVAKARVRVDTFSGNGGRDGSREGAQAKRSKKAARTAMQRTGRKEKAKRAKKKTQSSILRQGADTGWTRKRPKPRENKRRSMGKTTRSKHGFWSTGDAVRAFIERVLSLFCCSPRH